MFKKFLALCITFALFSQSVFAEGLIWYVDSNADDLPGTCVAGDEIADANCTFREAVQNAAASDTIRFLTDTLISATGNYTISQDNLVVDAEVDGFAVGIDGNGNGGSVPFGGLITISGNNVSVKGLSVYNSSGAGIVVDSLASGTVLDNLKLGVQVDGNTANGNAEAGLLVLGDNTTIQNSTISGNNGEAGILLWHDGDGAQDTYIFNNKIGLNSAGNAELGNSNAGIMARANAAYDLNGAENLGLFIESNFISANGSHGIDLSEQGGVLSGDVRIEGNKIGLLSDGSTAAGNVGRGIHLGGGGDLEVIGNVIVNNGTIDAPTGGISVAGGSTFRATGNKIGTLEDGVTPAGNIGGAIDLSASTLTSVVIGGGLSTLSNVIAASTNNFGAIMVEVPEATIVEIMGNYIGVGGDGTTTAGLGNSSDGINIRGGTVVIGGDNDLKLNTDDVERSGDLGEGNVISNNGTLGIRVSKAGGSVSIYGNVIGLVKGVSGVYDTASANVEAGVKVGEEEVAQEMGSVVIGALQEDGAFSDFSRRNIISGNGGSGIEVLEQAMEAGAEVTIKNNYLGTDISGTSSVANIEFGVSIGGNVVNLIQNVVSGNLRAGINVNGGIVDILGNYIGLDSTGSSALPNLNEAGIIIEGGAVSIGNGVLEDLQARNVISGNSGSGIMAFGTDGLIIDGNHVGVSADGLSAIANTVAGEFLGENVDGSGIIIMSFAEMDEASVTDNTIINNNLISGNEGSGIAVVVYGATQDWTNGYIKNNILGFAGDGVTVLSNNGYGIYVKDIPDAPGITALVIGGSNNSIETSSNFGIYLDEVVEASLHGGYDWISTHNDFSDPDAFSWQYVLNGAEQIVDQCNDGVDNNGDGNIDAADSGCAFAPFVEGDTSGDPAPAAGASGGATASRAATPAVEADVVEQPLTQPVEQVLEVPAEDSADEPETQVVPTKSENTFSLTDSVVKETIVNSLSEVRVISDFEIEHVISKFETLDVSTEAQSNEERQRFSALLDTKRSPSNNSRVEVAMQNSVEEAFNYRNSLDLNIGGEVRTVKKGENLKVVFRSLYTEEELEEISQLAKAEGQTLIETDVNEDLDNDGLPNAVEFALNPVAMFGDNFDGDAFDDMTEYFANLDPSVRDEMPKVTRPVKVNGEFSSGTPLIKFFGPAGDEISVVLVSKDDDMKKIELGTTVVDENNKALLVPNEEIPAGEYYVIAKGLKGIGELSKIRINPRSQSKLPVIKEFIPGNRTNCSFEAKFDWKTMSPVVNSACSFINDETPDILKVVVEPGVIVQAMWQSVIFNSVLISDASQEEVEIQAPEKLAKGNHQVIVFTKDPVSGVMSGIARLFFTIE